MKKPVMSSLASERPLTSSMLVPPTPAWPGPENSTVSPADGARPTSQLPGVIQLSSIPLASVQIRFLTPKLQPTSAGAEPPSNEFAALCGEGVPVTVEFLMLTPVTVNEELEPEPLAKNHVATASPCMIVRSVPAAVAGVAPARTLNVAPEVAMDTPFPTPVLNEISWERPSKSKDPVTVTRSPKTNPLLADVLVRKVPAEIETVLENVETAGNALPGESVSVPAVMLVAPPTVNVVVGDSVRLLPTESAPVMLSAPPVLVSVEPLEPDIVRAARVVPDLSVTTWVLVGASVVGLVVVRVTVLRSTLDPSSSSALLAPMLIVPTVLPPDTTEPLSLTVVPVTAETVIVPVGLAMNVVVPSTSKVPPPALSVIVGAVAPPETNVRAPESVRVFPWMSIVTFWPMMSPVLVTVAPLEAVAPMKIFFAAPPLMIEAPLATLIALVTVRLCPFRSSVPVVIVSDVQMMSLPSRIVGAAPPELSSTTVPKSKPIPPSVQVCVVPPEAGYEKLSVPEFVKDDPVPKLERLTPDEPPAPASPKTIKVTPDAIESACL
ncbi:hypothetical protein HY251_12370 [bacterium]|nr:hypothetical protein [bacterium]